MNRRARTLGVHLILLLSVLAPRIADAQRSRTILVLVRVRDTSDVAIGGVEVAVVRGLNDGQASGVTDDRGRVALSIADAVPNTDYQLAVRKIGYERADRFFRVTRDSLSFEIVLRRAVQELAPVVVRAEEDVKRKSYHIGADEIATTKQLLIDATDILLKLRPDMICGRSCSPMGSIATSTQNAVRRCPGLVFLERPGTRCSSSSSPPPLETNVWVNGRRIRMVLLNEMAIARQHGPLAGLLPGTMTVLSEIKPEHIAEITYLDSWDNSVGKIGSQNALFIVLKAGVAYEPGRESYVAEESRPSNPRALALATSELPAYRFRLLGVFDGETGDPIEGAEVIDMNTGTKARTTTTGTVSLVFLPEGGTPVRITKAGYEDLTLAVEISADHVDPLTLIMVKKAPRED